MSTFQINDAEWAALVEEPGDIFLAYCSIRRVMDYSTGVAGQARKISEQMLREVLYVAPCRGRHESGSPTRQRIRSVVDRLITLGALVQIGPMVFQLPLATRDSPPKRSATEQQPHQQPDQQPEPQSMEPCNGAGCVDSDDGSATVSASAKTAISNLPPVSGNNNTAHNAREAPADPGQRFPMTDAWEPGRESFGAVLHRNGLANQVFQADQLLEFRSYWISHPNTERTQGQWEHALAQQLKRQFRLNQSAEDNANETRGRLTRSRARSAYDVLSSPEW